MNIESYYNISQTARLLGVDRKTIRNWGASGKVKVIRPYDGVMASFISKTEVHELMEQRGGRK